MLKKLTVTAFVSVVALTLLPVPGSAMAPFCSRNADLARIACFADGRDDFWLNRANCINESDSDERRQCRIDAVTEWREKIGECRDQREARRDLCDLVGEDRYDPDFGPDIFVDPDEIGESIDPNPYFSLVPGHTYVLRTGDEGQEIVVVYVTDEVEEIEGVPCRVVADIALEEEENEEGEFEYSPLEVTLDWYAQTPVGDVHYCGELTGEFEDTEVLPTSLDGTFKHGVDGAKAGILIRAAPTVGETHRQEWALEEAEDAITYEALATGPTAEEGGENPLFPCADDCVKTFDFTSLDAESKEFKYYLREVGFVLAVSLDADREPAGEREELQCVGDSLEILDDDCGLEDSAAAQERLCEMATVFCDEDDDSDSDSD